MFNYVGDFFLAFFAKKLYNLENKNNIRKSEKRNSFRIIFLSDIMQIWNVGIKNHLISRRFDLMNNKIIIYQTVDGEVKIDCWLDGETLWLTQSQIAELFGRDRSVITRHINNIFSDGELGEKVVSAEIAHTTQHGAIADKTQTKSAKAYNLDAILAVGYRVKSPRGMQFRQWATTILHEYLQKGFAMNDDFLKNMGGGVYWKELLERIRDIRVSEKVMYRQVLDLYATSNEIKNKRHKQKSICLRRLFVFLLYVISHFKSNVSKIMV